MIRDGPILPFLEGLLEVEEEERRKNDNGNAQDLLGSLKNSTRELSRQNKVSFVAELQHISNDSFIHLHCIGVCILHHFKRTYVHIIMASEESLELLGISCLLLYLLFGFGEVQRGREEEDWTKEEKGEEGFVKMGGGVDKIGGAEIEGRKDQDCIYGEERKR